MYFFHHGAERCKTIISFVHVDADPAKQKVPGGGESRLPLGYKGASLDATAIFGPTPKAQNGCPNEPRFCWRLATKLVCACLSPKKKTGKTFEVSCESFIGDFRKFSADFHYKLSGNFEHENFSALGKRLKTPREAVKKGPERGAGAPLPGGGSPHPEGTPFPFFPVGGGYLSSL